MGLFKKFNKFLKNTRKSLTKADVFGIPITINYKGESHYKTFFGAICTFFIFFIIIAFAARNLTKMINRTDPDYSYFRLTVDRNQEDPLNLPEVNGQMYIGLRQTSFY